MASHRFLGVFRLNAYAFEARCACGNHTEQSPTKDGAYERAVDHFMETDEFAEMLKGKSECSGIHEPSKAELAPLLIVKRPGSHTHTISSPNTEAESREAHPSRRGRVIKQWYIGNHPNCDIVVPGDPYVSTRHCVVWVEDTGRVMVRDNNSTNGTHILRPIENPGEQSTVARIFVTGPTPMLAGDRLMVGRTVLDNFPPPEVFGDGHLRSDEG